MSDQSNLPVLTLDFDDEQIARLQQIVEEFRNLRFTAPSGESTLPAPTSDDEQPADDPQPGRLANEFKKFMDGTDRNGRRTLRTFRAINRELAITTDALGDLFATSIKWGTALAGVAAAGPLGYGLVANRVTESVRQAQGYNVSPGTLQAAEAAYGPYIGNVTGAFGQLAAAQYDPSNQLYAGLMALGLDPRDNPAENYPELLERVSALVEQYDDEGVALQYINSLGLGSVITPEVVNQLTANRERLPELRERYETATERNDQRLNPEVTAGYQAVSSSLAQNADNVTNSFLNAISRLQGPIVDLSDELTELVTNFLEGPNGEALFDSLAEGLEQLASWLGSEEFQSDLREFGEDISAAARGLRDFIKWLAEFFGQDPGELAAWGAGGAAALGILGAGGARTAVRAGGALAGQTARAAGGLIRISPLTALPLALLPSNNTPDTAGEFEQAGVRPWWQVNPPQFDENGVPVDPESPDYQRAGNRQTVTGFSDNFPLVAEDYEEPGRRPARERGAPQFDDRGVPVYSDSTANQPTSSRPGLPDYAERVPLLAGGEPETNQTRGIRNHNPGNLRYAGQRGARRDADGFAVFEDNQAGIAALDRQIELYLSRGIDTISEIIETYAPPNENRTDEYIDFVSQRTGIDADEEIARNDVVATSRIIRAIIDMESGRDAREVTNRDINRAVIERRQIPIVPMRDPITLDIRQQPGSDYRAQVQGQNGGN